jgi:hypothetical protein
VLNTQVNEIYDFYRELGYDVNIDGGSLTISSKYTLVTSDLHALKPLIASLDKVPILQYAGSSYIFVRDPSRLPDLSPILGKPTYDWIPLPSGEGAAFDQAYWLASLRLALNELPSVTNFLISGVLERVEALRGSPVTDTSEADGLAKACIGGTLTIAEAHIIVGPGGAKDLNAAIIANLSPEPIELKIETPVLEQEPEQAPIPEPVSELIFEPTSEPIPEPIPERRSLFADALLPNEYHEPVHMASDEINWTELLSDTAPGALTPLHIVAVILSIEDIGLPEDPLISLALLDMAITAMPPTLTHPDELFSYIWPTRRAIRVNVEFHVITSQILAGILLRFSMGCDSGFLMEGGLSLEEMFYKNPSILLSDLFGAPEVISWIERYVLTAPAPQLTSRTQKIAEIIKQVGEEIMPDVSTAYYRQLISNHRG